MKGRVYTDEERKARGAIYCDKGLTEQSHRDACDINKIMATYEKTGLVPVNTQSLPTHGDFTNFTDYQSALNLIIEAEHSFNSLPAIIRREYDHDPAKFLAALDDPDQKARLIELGVLVEPQIDETNTLTKGTISSAPISAESDLEA